MGSQGSAQIGAREKVTRTEERDTPSSQMAEFSRGAGAVERAPCPSTPTATPNKLQPEKKSEGAEKASAP